jgi:large subunit ribosomal protein L21
MYAVLMTGGKQYRVEAGSTLVVEKVGGEPGSSVTFDRILLVADGDAVTVGSPTVAGASVGATVLGEALGPKIVVFKFKQKVKYRRRTGHRQHLTRLRIDSISAGGKTVKAEPPEPTAPRKIAATPEKTPRRAVKAEAAQPTRRRAAAEAAVPVPALTELKPSRKRAAPEASVTKEQASAPPKRARRTKASSASQATDTAGKASSVEGTKPKARTRRATKPKTESAKEE